MSDINDYVELWSRCLTWLDEPDAGDRLGVLLTEIDAYEGKFGLFQFLCAAVLSGAPAELIDRDNCLYALDVPQPDWQGHKNLMLAAGQFMVATVRTDFDMACAIFNAQFDGDDGFATMRTAAFITLVLHVAKDRPYLGVIIGRH